MSEPEIEERHGFPGALRASGGVGGHFGAPHVDDAAIRTRALTKRYGKIEAVRGIELDVGRGEIFGLIGPDGAGKTSTFQILGGVMEATSGDAELLGRPARQARVLPPISKRQLRPVTRLRAHFAREDILAFLPCKKK